MIQIAPKLFSIAESPTINSNLVAYLSSYKKDGEKLHLHLYVIYCLLILTALNISVTYVCIHIYLKMKHTKAINIAEKTQWAMKVTLISLRHLACGFYCFLFIGVYNFGVYYQNSYQNIQSVPPGSILVNFVCVWISLQFALTKKEIIDFLKRRLASPLPKIHLFSRPFQQNSQSLNIEKKRTFAWN